MAACAGGELAGLRRCDVDTRQGTVRVERSLTELPGGHRFGPPKSAAGKRVVVVPAVIRPELAHHLATFTVSQPDALVFTSLKGAPLRDGSFRRRVWYPALAQAGLRNPMYVALQAVIVGQALVLGQRRLLGYAVIAAVPPALFVRLYEEPALAARFGEEYEQSQCRPSAAACAAAC